MSNQGNGKTGDTYQQWWESSQVLECQGDEGFPMVVDFQRLCDFKWNLTINVSYEINRRIKEKQLN